jgi:hypothetical protein
MLMAVKDIQIEDDPKSKIVGKQSMRLRKIAGLDRPSHFHRPVERAFPVIDTCQPPRHGITTQVAVKFVPPKSCGQKYRKSCIDIGGSSKAS